jgi:hypothetical protein
LGLKGLVVVVVVVGVSCVFYTKQVALTNDPKCPVSH